MLPAHQSSFNPSICSKEMWLYFQNGDPTDFTFTGFLLGEVFEDCGGGAGNGSDEDCDGVPDNGCSAFALGAECYASADCLSDNCLGASRVSGVGNGGGDLSDDVPGVCMEPWCGDRMFNSDEIDLDCGGSCGSCAAGCGCTA